MKKTKRSSQIDSLGKSSPTPKVEPEKEQDFFDAEDIKSLEEENKNLKDEIMSLKSKTPNELLSRENKDLFNKVVKLQAENAKLLKEKDSIKKLSEKELAIKLSECEMQIKSLSRENEIKSERIVDLLTENKQLSKVKSQFEEYDKKITTLEAQVKRYRENIIPIAMAKPFAQLVGYVDGEPVMYRIKVETKEESYEIKRRYREFLNLYSEISKVRSNLPKFPDKLILGNRSDQNIKKRCDGLTSFVDYVSNDKELLTSKLVIQFFAK